MGSGFWEEGIISIFLLMVPVIWKITRKPEVSTEITNYNGFGERPVVVVTTRTHDRLLQGNLHNNRVAAIRGLKAP